MRKTILALSFMASQAFALTPEEYVYESQDFINSCNTLVALFEDRAMNGVKYRKLITDELAYRIDYYNSKYNSEPLTINDSNMLMIEVSKTCMEYTKKTSTEYIRIDKVVSDVVRVFYKK